MLRQTHREGRYSGAPVHIFLSVFGSNTFSQLFSLFWVCLFLVAKVVFHFLLIQFLNQALK